MTGAVQVGNPRLDRLRDNGGPTATHALLPDSPAIDAGDPNGCRDALGALLTADQRGFARPVGSACDIGAFEAVGPLRCSYSLDPASVFVPTAGTEGMASVRTNDSQCSWIAASTVSWIVVTAGYGMGNGTLTYIVRPNPGGARAGTVNVGGQIFTLRQASHEASAGDFDGDCKTDIAVYRPSSGTWFILTSTSGFVDWLGYAWGVSTDVPVPGDYDGDGRIDVAVYRPSTGHWFILKSSTTYTAWDTYQWGAPGDIPVPGDYDGDGRTDIATYWYLDEMNSGWRILQSSTGREFICRLRRRPRASLCRATMTATARRTRRLYDPSTGQWRIWRSTNPGWSEYQWGTTGDIPVPADYDGDGKTGYCHLPAFERRLVRPSVEHRLRGWGRYAWGRASDVPVPGDYDGDGKADLAVYRPSTGHWFILKSSTAFTIWDTYQLGHHRRLPILGPS